MRQFPEDDEDADVGEPDVDEDITASSLDEDAEEDEDEDAEPPLTTEYVDNPEYTIDPPGLRRKAEAAEVCSLSELMSVILPLGNPRNVLWCLTICPETCPPGPVSMPSNSISYAAVVC